MFFSPDLVLPEVPSPANINADTVARMRTAEAMLF
jgi:hypothetical protein